MMVYKDYFRCCIKVDGQYTARQMTILLVYYPIMCQYFIPLPDAGCTVAVDLMKP